MQSGHMRKFSVRWFCSTQFNYAYAAGDIASTRIDKAIDPKDQEEKEGSLRPTLKRPFKTGGKRMGKDIERFAASRKNCC